MLSSLRVCATAPLFLRVNIFRGSSVVPALLRAAPPFCAIESVVKASLVGSILDAVQGFSLCAGGEPSDDGQCQWRINYPDSDSDFETAPDIEPEPQPLLYSTLQLGGRAEHDMLRITGKVLAIHEDYAQRSIEGIEVEFEEHTRGKVLLEWEGKMKGRWPKIARIRRWVFADALHPLTSAGSSSPAGSSSAATFESPESPESPNVFRAMHEAAAELNAFTHGMEPPALALIHRKRKMKRCTPRTEKGTGAQLRERKTAEPNIPAQQRLDEFPDQSFAIDAGSLFCHCCVKVLSLRKQTLVVHSNSSVHAEKLSAWQLRNRNDSRDRELLTTHFDQEDMKSRTISLDTQLYRLQACLAMHVV
jgi:hypothetical protein